MREGNTRRMSIEEFMEETYEVASGLFGKLSDVLSMAAAEITENVFSESTVDKILQDAEETVKSIVEEYKTKYRRNLEFLEELGINPARYGRGNLVKTFCVYMTPEQFEGLRQKFGDVEIPSGWNTEISMGDYRFNAEKIVLKDKYRRRYIIIYVVDPEKSAEIVEIQYKLGKYGEYRMVIADSPGTGREEMTEKFLKEFGNLRNEVKIISYTSFREKPISVFY